MQPGGVSNVQATARKPARIRCRQLAIPTVLTLVAILVAWLAVGIHEARLQRTAVLVFQPTYGQVRYDFHPIEIEAVDGGADSAFPDWMLDILGIDFFHNVAWIELNRGASTEETVQLWTGP